MTHLSPSVETVPGGCHLSPLVQGYWRLADWDLDARRTLAFLEAHVDLGVTSVDHADIYGDYRCEALFGEALALRPGLREQLQVVTKCNIMLRSERYPQRRIKHYDTSAAHIERSVEQSLQRLRTDRIDLLLLHRPDPLMDADEVAGAFDRLHRDGKVLHFGVSNFAPAEFTLLQSRLTVVLATNQVEINPFSLSALPAGTLEQAQELRLRPMAWSVLAGGRVFREEDDAARRVRKAAHEVATSMGGVELDQVLLAWAMSLPCQPLPILGSGRMERVRAAVVAADLRLEREAWFGILESANGAEVP